MFEEYEESRIYPTNKRAMAEYCALLEKEGIRRDGNLEYTLGLYDSDYRLVATGSYYKNTLRCLAVDSSHQGEGLMNRVVSRLSDLEAQRGIFHLFLYTKCDKVPLFRDIGFAEICRVEGLVAFLENRRDGFANYLAQLQKEQPADAAGKKQAAIVMNANPFTLGHRWLVEQAASQCDLLHLFVVTEDASLVPFQVRYQLVKEGVADIPNVLLHQTGSYMISSSTFPSYFIKDAGDVIQAQARLDIQVFKKIASALGISARYVGEEPFSQVTAAYNQVMAEELPKDGIDCVVIPRREEGGQPISASAVRQLIHEGRLEEIRPLVPDSTYRFFLTPEGEKVAEAIRSATEVIHY
jgi:[citrate (pro-3S)-lyase] ligase